MVTDTQRLSSIQFETTQLRRQADELLRRLVENRDAIERRIEDAGRYDPIKTITGRSALDLAIDDARDLVARADRLLGRSNGTASATNGRAVQSKVMAVVR